MERKKMAIVSSYNVLCGNATYTEVLRKEFEKYYEVDVLALKTDILGSNKREVSRLADKHIHQIAQKLKQYDYVNIQFEAGLYGTSRKSIYKRIKWLISSCRSLTFTMHRVDIPESIFDREFLKKMLSGNVFKNLKQFRQNVYMAQLYKKIVLYIKRGALKHNFNIIVHTKREKDNIQQLWGFDKVYDFPLTFMDEQMRKRTPKDCEKREFHNKYGMKDSDIIIGIFGFISEYKGHETVIKALKYLPKQYKVIVFGSQHPMSIFKNVPVDPYIDKLLKIIEKDNTDSKNKKHKVDTEGQLNKRVFFAGGLNDQDFIDALYCCDFAVLPYLETNQSGSGIASLVLESKIKSLYSNNKAFFELQRYYPNSFEIFDIGNYNELAYKILNYHHDFREQIDMCLKTYNLENNVRFQKKLLEGMNE